MEYHEHVPLGPKTTLGIGGDAEWYAMPRSHDELGEACAFARARNLSITILGGGSNVLIGDSGVHGLVLSYAGDALTYTQLHDGRVAVRVEAGAVFDRVIGAVVEEGLWGLENLSAIPGTVGAVPIQNVGAYGVEASDVVNSVTVFDPVTGSVQELSRDVCAFGYRDSYFKRPDGRHLVVTAVTFALTRTPSPKLAYKDLALAFAGASAPSLHDIRRAVTEIRGGKFPDWHTLGTAGSFFKNPVIPRAAYEALLASYPGLPGFPSGDAVKVSLGWILDHVLHLRGYREGNVGLYEKQALVLVHYGGGTASEVIDFSAEIMERVMRATGIAIEREVMCIGV